MECRAEEVLGSGRADPICFLLLIDWKKALEYFPPEERFSHLSRERNKVKRLQDKIFLSSSTDNSSQTGANLLNGVMSNTGSSLVPRSSPGLLLSCDWVRVVWYKLGENISLLNILGWVLESSHYNYLLKTPSPHTSLSATLWKNSKKYFALSIWTCLQVSLHFSKLLLKES